VYLFCQAFFTTFFIFFNLLIFFGWILLKKNTILNCIHNGILLMNEKHDTFKLWATSDAHVIRESLGDSSDPNALKRESMRIAVEQADSSKGFDYDIGLQLGDILDYDYETIEGYRQYLGQLNYSSKDRHYWYHVGGNNDENSVLNDDVSMDNEYYRKYIDPTGEFTGISGVDNNKRPYPVNGTYERYYFDVGNMRFLFLSDRNDLPAPYGRGEGGFYVDGAITLESYQWLVDQIIKNPDKIIAVCCHHPLKDTTIGSGIDESWLGQFMCGYNPKFYNVPKNRLQPVLHQVYNVDKFDSPKFRSLLSQNPGSVNLWISGHIHHLVDETYNKKGKYAYAYGGHHFNVGTICRYRHHKNIISAQSTLFTFNADSAEFDSKVYVHDHPCIPQGFYEPEHRTLKLSGSFSKEYLPEKIAMPSIIENFRIKCECSSATELSWENSNTGVLIIRQNDRKPDFKPEDDCAYYAGQSAGSAQVVFMGTAAKFTDNDIKSGNKYFYSAFAYNAGNGHVKYSAGKPASVHIK
jgi:hypothetical protein